MFSTSPTLHAQKRSSGDELVFADTQSEQKHQVLTEFSQTTVGGLGQPARLLIPKDNPHWQGGILTFTMQVDPARQNYFTAKFWGSDKDHTLLMLFCEGKQVGYRHIGDIDLLWLGNGEPAFTNRFFYVTLPLPLQQTAGKTKVTLSIKAFGEIWPYGYTFQAYQKEMTQPSLGIYRAYTHTESEFLPENKEVQGKEIANPPIRKTPGSEIMDRLKERVNKELAAILAVKRPLSQQEIMFLAPAYSVKWTIAYQKPEVIAKVITSVDSYYKGYLQKPDTIWTDKDVYNSDWLVTGPIARGIRQLWPQIEPQIDETFDRGGGQTITHRKAWSDLLMAHQKYGLTHRRQYTNQSMIVDVFLYDCNRALLLVDPQHALPEYQALRYLYESVGLAPWLGNETANGPERPLGDNYWQLTAKGLTKELGFVGYYGEVLDWVVDIYQSTCTNGIPGTGDAKIKQQLLKMMRARSYFRYPALDSDGNKAMRSEAVIGWRDGSHYPGDVTYGDRAIAWDASPIMTAAATLDSQAVGFAQQMLEDNQFFYLLEEKMKFGGIRVTKSLLRIPDEYESILRQPKRSTRLPMANEMPDVVFSDEEDGVVALKNGQDILYASLYWRAHRAVNNLAKIHFITPTIDRIANVHVDTQIDSSGMQYTRPNWVNIGSTGSREFYPGVESANAGEVLPIARIPQGIRFKPGTENAFAGKASFYQLAYGNYLLGMNTTSDRTYELAIPAAFNRATNLVDKTTIGDIQRIRVPPKTTVVLFKKLPH